MNTKNFFLAAAGLVVAAALLVWVEARQATRDAEAALAASAAASVRLKADLARAEARIATVERTRDEVQTVLDGARAGKPVTGGGTAPARVAPAAVTVMPREALMNDPKLQALWLNSGRARLAQEYGPLFTALALPSAQAERFVALAMKRQEQLMDLAGAAQTQGADSKQAVAALQQKANEECQAAQAELLGADGFRRLQEHERSAQIRSTVDAFVGAAVLAGEPISAAQAGQLTEALANATSRFAAGGRAEVMTVNWGAADAQARQILTPTQFALFTTAAPIVGGASRWNVQLEAAIARAKEREVAEGSASAVQAKPKQPGS